MNNQSANKKYNFLFKNTSIFAIGVFGSKLITFFLVPLYTNVLTTEEYGSADLVTTLANIIVPIISLVIYDSVLRFGLSKSENTDSVIKNAFIVIAIGSLIAAAITPFCNFNAIVSEWKYYLLAISVSSFLCTNRFKGLAPYISS